MDLLPRKIFISWTLKQRSSQPLKWTRPCHRQYDHRWFSTKKSWCFSNLDQQTTVYCTSDYSWKIAIVPCRYERTMDITIWPINGYHWCNKDWWNPLSNHIIRHQRSQSRLAVLDLTSGELELVADPNEALMNDLSISEPQRFGMRSRWLAKSKDGIYHRSRPVKSTLRFLYIHGGPQVCYGETFFHEMQVHAANGYGVILLNPRGAGKAMVRSLFARS